MPEVSFPYAEIKTTAGKVLKRPMVRAKITAQNGRFYSMPVILDTGADACLLPTILANLLGLDYVSFPSDMTVGVGSSNVTYYTTVNIDIGSGVSADVYAGFTDGMNGAGIGLLGQLGFFEKFDVHFSHKKGVCTVTVP